MMSLEEASARKIELAEETLPARAGRATKAGPAIGSGGHHRSGRTGDAH